MFRSGMFSRSGNLRRSMPPEQFSLAGRTALVTGSTGGLGLAIAAALARCGCNIVLHGLAPPEKVDDRTADLRDVPAVGRCTVARTWRTRPK